MYIVYLLLGSNVGDRKSWLSMARAALEEHTGTIAKASHIYETAPWGLTTQSPFLNQALEVHTRQSPEEVLHAIEIIEAQAERARDIHWGPRTLDIDILLYDDLIIETARLSIPHPRIQYRRFVLTPLAEIAADVVHPVLETTMQELLTSCDDQSEVGILAEG